MKRNLFVRFHNAPICPGQKAFVVDTDHGWCVDRVHDQPDLTFGALVGFLRSHPNLQVHNSMIQLLSGRKRKANWVENECLTTPPFEIDLRVQVQVPLGRQKVDLIR